MLTSQECATNKEGKLLFNCSLDSKYLMQLNYNSEGATESRLVFE